MSTALEKFTAAMNRNSPFWTKKTELTAQHGKIIYIRCEGFVYKSDEIKGGEPCPVPAEKSDPKEKVEEKDTEKSADQSAESADFW